MFPVIGSDFKIVDLSSNLNDAEQKLLILDPHFQLMIINTNSGFI